MSLGYATAWVKGDWAHCWRQAPALLSKSHIIGFFYCLNLLLKLDCCAYHIYIYVIQIILQQLITWLSICAQLYDIIRNAIQQNIYIWYNLAVAPDKWLFWYFDCVASCSSGASQGFLFYARSKAKSGQQKDLLMSDLALLAMHGQNQNISANSNLPVLQSARRAVWRGIRGLYHNWHSCRDLFGACVNANHWSYLDLESNAKFHRISHAYSHLSVLPCRPLSCAHST